MNKEKMSMWVFLVGVFAFFLMFFCVIHPLVPIDSDDWMFMSANRIALPSLHAWNPSRVLPETLMPMVSGLAAFTIYPLTGDYFGAQTFMHVSVVSLFIMLYVYMFLRLLKNRFFVSTPRSVIYAILFLLMHFLVFRTADSYNTHLFFSRDLTCYYFYQIPNMINAMVVMSLLEHDWLHDNHYGPVRNGLIILIVYLCICSNLFCSDILVIYLGCGMLVDVIKNRNDISVKSFSKKYISDFIIIGLWLIVNIMEVMGPRSAFLGDAAGGKGLLDLLTETIHYMMTIRVNVFFLLLIVLGVCSAILFFRRNRQLPIFAVTMLLSSVVTFIYAVIVSAKAQPDYIIRADVLFAVLFPVMVLVILSVEALQRVYDKVLYVLPVYMLVMYSMCLRTDQTYRDFYAESPDCNCSIDTYKSANDNILQQLLIADQKHLNEVVLKVPHISDDGMNWPYCILYDNYFNWITKTLYKHGVIHSIPKGKCVMDKPLSAY